MPLRGIERVLCACVTVEEIMVIGIQRDRSRQFQGPVADRLGQSQLRLEPPAVRSQVDQLAVVVLTGGDRDLQARPDNEVLTVRAKILQIECRRTEQIHRQSKPRVGKSFDLALVPLPGEAGRSRQPGVGHDDVELSRLAPKIECLGVGDDRARGVQLRIGDRQRGVERNAAARVGVAGDQKVDPDRRVRIRARLDVLSLRVSRGAQNQDGANESRGQTPVDKSPAQSLFHGSEDLSTGV